MSYQVTITLPRSPRNGTAVPTDSQVLAEAAVAAYALMTAWTSATELLSMAAYGAAVIAPRFSALPSHRSPRAAGSALRRQ